MKKIRVYFPLGSEYYMESPWVEINKKRAFEPVTGQPQLKLAGIIEEAVQKGSAIIDASMSLDSCYSPSQAPTASSSGKMSYGLGYGEEIDQIELKLTLGDATIPGVARLGLAPAACNIGIFGALANAEGIVVDGTYGAETLNTIGKLANFGFLKFTKIHVVADDEQFFAATPVLESFSHTGDCNTKRVHYTKSTDESDNTNIRDLTAMDIKNRGLDLTMNGKNFFTVPVPAGTSANVTLYTHFYPKH